MTLVTLSEFGRRVRENASGGLDHGHGNLMLLMGGGVVGGRMHGGWPGLDPAGLVDGDLPATNDYRRGARRAAGTALRGAGVRRVPGAGQRPPRRRAGSLTRAHDG